MKEIKEMKERKEIRKTNQAESQMGSQVGRRPVFRWPGLELTSAHAPSAPAALTAPYTRQQELALAEKGAATREEKYGGEADLFGLKFDVGPDGPHTTIDFDKWERSVYGKGGDNGNEGHDDDYDKGDDKGDDKGGGFAIVTTSDFLIYNKIKRLMKQSESGDGGENTELPPIEIVDLKFSQTGRAVYFVTAKLPIKFLKKLLQNS